MSYLLCSKCKSYFKLQSGESAKDFVDLCYCGGKLRYVENLDIIDPQWKQITIKKKPTKKEFLRNKIYLKISNWKMKFKNWLIRLGNRYRNLFQKSPYRNKYYNPNYARGVDILYYIKNEFNLDNVQWTLVIPVAIAITIILTITQGILTLLIFILLTSVGYLFKDQLIGTKNAIITGTISFFLGSLFTGSFLYLIPYTLLGAINGAVCGWIGGYIKKLRSQRI